MPLSLYQASVPVYVKLLHALSAILDKAETHAKENKYEPEALLTARLFPDMWPLAVQVQEAESIVRRGTARLAGVPFPTLSEARASFADLKAQIAATVEFLQSVDRAAIEAGAERQITFPAGGNDKRTMTGTQYWLDFTLPNFYFH